MAIEFSTWASPDGRQYTVSECTVTGEVNHQEIWHDTVGKVVKGVPPNWAGGGWRLIDGKSRFNGPVPKPTTSQGIFATKSTLKAAREERFGKTPIVDNLLKHQAEKKAREAAEDPRPVVQRIRERDGAVAAEVRLDEDLVALIASFNGMDPDEIQDSLLAGKPVPTKFNSYVLKGAQA
jgi:hypothetical protein